MFNMHLFSEAAVWICHFRGQEGQGEYEVSYFVFTLAVTFALISARAEWSNSILCCSRQKTSLYCVCIENQIICSIYIVGFLFDHNIGHILRSICNFFACHVWLQVNFWGQKLRPEFSKKQERKDYILFKSMANIFLNLLLSLCRIMWV